MDIVSDNENCEHKNSTNGISSLVKEPETMIISDNDKIENKTLLNCSDIKLKTGAIDNSDNDNLIKNLPMEMSDDQVKNNISNVDDLSNKINKEIEVKTNGDKSDDKNDNNFDEVEGKLSKRQLRKLKKREKWLASKTDKRLKERAKMREKRAFKRANNIDLGPSRKALKKCTMADSSCKVTVTIDLSFDDLMISRDVAKLIKQILRCYTLNRRAVAPLQFSLTGFTGKSKQEMEKHNGYEHWDVKFFTESYIKAYEGKKIVYLTSESENVIDTLDQNSVYVIGGLVDHNYHKGICYKLAKEAGVEHARLPLDKFLRMKARKVLTIDHVFEIMLRMTEGKTWQESFLQVLPMRKNAELVQSTPDETDDDDEEDKDDEIYDNEKNTQDVKIEEDEKEEKCEPQTNTSTS